MTTPEDMAVVYARAKAKIRGENYDPALHGPFANELPPRQQQRKEQPPSLTTEEMDGRLKAVIDRIMARVGTMPADPEPPPPPPPPQPTAAEIRIARYIPKRHVENTLDNYRCYTKSQQAALAATREWVQSVIRGEAGTLGLLGEVGTGKSHLLYGAVRAVNEAGIHCAAAGWYDLADTFRLAKFGHDEENEAARIRKGHVLAAGAFGLDDIRPTSSSTDFDATELAQLMIRAYRECQGVLVTSNHADERLKEIIGLAAASRLTQITIAGPDMRDPRNKKLRPLSG